MNNQAHQHHIPRDAPGIYPFAGLPVRLGFPSSEDFEIVQHDDGRIVVVARRAFLRITRMCRVSGQLLPYRCRQTRQLLAGIHLYDPRFCGLLELYLRPECVPRHERTVAMGAARYSAGRPPDHRLRGHRRPFAATVRLYLRLAALPWVDHRLR
jgi:hypothetical protein